MKISWTKAAITDLNEIEDYIKQDDERAAIKQVLRILDIIEETISEKPKIGRIGRISGTREFYVPGTPYIIAYKISQDNTIIDILRVLHGARRWPNRI